MDSNQNPVIQFAVLFGIAVPALAQEPPAPPMPKEPPAKVQPAEPRLQPAADVDFLSLRDLLNEQVHTLMALEAKDPRGAQKPRPADGSDNTLAQPIASIYDATFDAEGNLVALIVAAGKRGDGAATVVLPAREVRWHPVRRLLVTDLGANQIAGLTPQHAPRDKTPAEAAARTTWLASELLAATPRCHSDEPKPADGGKVTVQSIWYVPAASRIGFVTLDQDRHLVPWNVVRPLNGGPPLVLEVSAPADRLTSAPMAADIAKAPDAAVRLQCYRHFAVNVPSWDHPTEPPRNPEGK
jgi:hypothetical protein